MSAQRNPGFTRGTSKSRKSPSKAMMKSIREAFDPVALKRVCESKDFSEYATRIDLGIYRGEESFYYFRDNGSKILAVAHLDHVQSDGTCHVINSAAGPLAVSGALDDRLGAYVILELLPKLGITCDWLLTTNEEIGASTAEQFPFDAGGNLVVDKDYNWIIEFDRGGTDVVMYDYETDDLIELVEKSGARVGRGSYSDISVMEHLGVAAFNWGVGYEDYHGPRSHAFLEDTFRMVARFKRFHTANADTYLEHEPKRYEAPERHWSEFADDEDLLNRWLREREEDDVYAAALDEAEAAAQADEDAADIWLRENGEAG